jgi:hypothetical protein
MQTFFIAPEIHQADRIPLFAPADQSFPSSPCDPESPAARLDFITETGLVTTPSRPSTALPRSLACIHQACRNLSCLDHSASSALLLSDGPTRERFHHCHERHHISVTPACAARADPGAHLRFQGQLEQQRSEPTGRQRTDEAEEAAAAARRSPIRFPLPPFSEFSSPMATSKFLPNLTDLSIPQASFFARRRAAHAGQPPPPRPACALLPQRLRMRARGPSRPQDAARPDSAALRAAAAGPCRSPASSCRPPGNRDQVTTARP